MNTTESLLFVIIIVLVVIDLRNTARDTELKRLLSDFATMVGDLLDPKED